MFACPRCGAPNPPGNQFCSNCGIALTASVQPATIPAPYSPMWPPALAPPSTSNLTAIVVVVVIVILVALAGVAAVFVGRQISVPISPSPRVMGVVVARSADGTNWTLTITSVPTGLYPSTAKLAVATSGGATALAPTPFVSLNYASQRAAYIPSQPGGPVAVGDRLLLSTTTYSTGYTYQISDSTSILAAGMLR